MSLELQKALSGYESYINNHGICLEVVEAYHTAVFWANEKDNDIETAVKIAPRAKDVSRALIPMCRGRRRLPCWGGGGAGD